MPDIYATNDGRAIHYSTSNWVDARANQPANTISTGNRTSDSIASAKYSGRGGSQWEIARQFYTFDTSGISSTPSSATLKVFGYSNNAGDIIALKSDYSSSLVVADFDNITNGATPLGNTDGSGAGTFASTSVVEYSGELATWSTSGYNDITLNSDALSDMASLSTFKVVLVNYDHDYLDIEPSSTLRNGSYNSSNTGTSKDPYIDYTAATTTVTNNAVFFGANF